MMDKQLSLWVTTGISFLIGSGAIGTAITTWNKLHEDMGHVKTISKQNREADVAQWKVLRSFDERLDAWERENHIPPHEREGQPISPIPPRRYDRESEKWIYK
jgi:hypothetical protein